MPIELDGLTLYTVEELSEKLSVSVNTIRDYIRSGKLKGRKMGIKWFISSDSLQEYFNRDLPVMPHAYSDEEPEE